MVVVVLLVILQLVMALPVVDWFHGLTMAFAHILVVKVQLLLLAVALVHHELAFCGRAQEHL